MPNVADDEARNAHLRRCCIAELGRTVSGQNQTIGCMFELEKAQAMALPAREFDPCIYASAKVDHYQTVRYDKARYSVPRGCP